MAVMYSSNSISWVTPVFFKAICMTSCSLGGSTISLRLRLEILVASEVTAEQRHERVILIWYIRFRMFTKPLANLTGWISVNWNRHFKYMNSQKEFPVRRLRVSRN